MPGEWNILFLFLEKMTIFLHVLLSMKTSYFLNIFVQANQWKLPKSLQVFDAW